MDVAGSARRGRPYVASNEASAQSRRQLPDYDCRNGRSGDNCATGESSPPLAYDRLRPLQLPLRTVLINEVGMATQLVSVIDAAQSARVSNFSRLSFLVGDNKGSGASRGFVRGAAGLPGDIDAARS